MRSPPSIFAANARSLAVATSTCIRAKGHCRLAPPVCEFFRQLPDALEQAAELDAQYGSNPDFEKMPLYGVVFSFKDSFDTRDMRSTGGGDAAYDIDFTARDHLLF
jgi:Asp-tRNA(Asn)/Glu-tRNA(Gln) amidotransferase A subunit family amidase